MKRTKTKSIFGALCLFFGISLFSVFCNIILNTVSASAYSITVTTSGSMTADVFPAAGDNIGTTIVTDNVGVISNCRAGYTLSISGPSDNNLYLNGNSSNNTTGTYFTPVDGTNALNSTVNANKWGYSLTATTQNGVFTPLSNTANTLLTPSQTASPNSDINTVTPVYYGTSVNKDMPPGSYTFSNNDAITYNVVMDATCMVVNIAYDGNNADAGTMGAAGTGVIHTGVKDGDTVELIASNFSRTGYGFAGWSLDPNAGAKLIDNDSTNNPIVYGPQETITLPNGFTNYDTDNDGIVKLYAVWIPSQGSLQGWVGCNSLDTTTYNSTTGALDLTKNSVTALTDQRDNDTYAVARLADGNCWMIENLRLDNDAAHNSDGLLAQGYGGQFVGLADSEIGKNFAYLPSSFPNNSLYSNDGSSNTINIGTDNPAYRMPRYNSINTKSRATNPSSSSFPEDNTTGGLYSYGNYYTWPAAAASTDALLSDSQSTLETSLCPAGWHLPTGGRAYASDSDSEINKTGSPATYSEFYNLGYKIMNEVKTAFEDTPNGNEAYYSVNTTNTSGDTAAKAYRKYPNNFVYSGGAYFSAISNRGKYGSYWSSTTSKYLANAYNLSVGPSNVYPATYSGYRYSGRSVRCVVPNNLYAVHFDANTTDTFTGIMPDQSIAVGATVALKTNTFQRPATSSSAYRFVKWNTKPNGSGVDYFNKTPVTNLAAVGQTITLYAQWEQFTPMTVNFMSNGLDFESGSSLNTVYYDNSACSMQTITKYSHTSNIRNDGTQIGNAEYDADLASKDVVTIPGANKLHVTITYGIEEEYDMLYVFQGEYTGPVTADMSAGQLKTYTGGDNTTTTIELDIPGDTATFAFYSDEDVQYWGYYASVIGIDSNNNEIIDTVCSRAIANGEYKKPIINNHQEFLGWSESQSATTADYTTADEVLNNLPGNNGETKTLYAVWRNLYIMTFVNTATGATQTKTVVVGQNTTIAPSTSWSRTGYKLRGWDIVTNDGSGSVGTAVYTNGQSITPTSDMTFYTVWRPAYSFTYDINTTDSNAAGTMGNQTSIAEGDSVTLLASNFSRTGYGFAGWSLDPNAANNTSAKIYGPQETITAPTYPGTSTLTFYAVWIASAGSIQDTSKVTNICNNLTKAPIDGTANLSSVSALTDSRDNNTYAVAKLADGNCWMIENLRLENTASHNSDGALAQGYGGQFVGLATAEPAWANNSTAANSLYSTNGGNSTINIGTSNAGYRFPRYNHDNTNARAANPAPKSNSSAMYSYGNYYTWPAAIANTTDYTSNNTSVINTSICPSGWHLPKGGNKSNEANNEFWSLVVTGINNGATPANYTSSTTPNYTGTAEAGPVDKKLRSYPNNFVYSGSIYSGYVRDRGMYGKYWSSTANSSYYAYNLYLYSSNINPGANYNSKYDGGTVRCVASDPTTPANKIGYFPNAAGVTDTMDDQSITSTDTEATLWASNFKRPGYGFAGWNTKADGSGAKYGPNETITFPAGQYSGEKQGLSLYAMWVESEGDLQGWTGCSAMNINDITALTDTRDNQTYAVAKLADGKCWMIENLRLADQTPTGNPITLNNTNTNNPISTFTQLSASVNPTATTRWCTSNNSACIDQSMFFSGNTTNPVTNMTSSDSNIYSYGNYYNWYSATAGNGIYSKTSGNTTSDICPLGWHLPTGGNASAEFGTLDIALGGTGVYQTDNAGAAQSGKWRSYPNNFIYSGRVGGPSVYSRNTVGSYWSSTAYGNNDAYSLFFSNKSVYPGAYNHYKNYGRTVRCLVSGS